jgi:DNA-binding NtrC family response regulator
MPLGKLLLVDDEASLLKLIAVYLGRLGYEIATSTSTDEAWKLLEPSPGAFDAVLLDMTMEGLSAGDLALRLLQGDAAVKIIASSGYPVDMTLLEEAGPGRIEFLHKPYTPEMLAESFRRILRH